MKIRDPKPVSITRRLLAANAAVLALALLLLALTPVTVSAPIGVAELAVLVAGGLALLAINWALIGVMMMGRREAERLQTSRAVLAGQEGERLRVARELHDEVGQGLIAITLMAERAAAESPPDVAAQFTAIADKLLFYLDELRRIAHELRPETLDDLGLVNALERALQRRRRRPRGRRRS